MQNHLQSITLHTPSTKYSYSEYIINEAPTKECDTGQTTVNGLTRTAVNERGTLATEGSCAAEMCSG
jgi:hypothetical protein